MPPDNSVPPNDAAIGLRPVLAARGMPEGQQAIVTALAEGALDLARRLREAQGAEVGADGATTNRFGEEQTPLDVLTDRLFREHLDGLPSVAAIATEESAVTLHGDAGAAGERYLVALDPLDGSKNFDIGGPLGTIFGVFRDFVTAAEENHGIGDVVCAGYVLYSWVPVLVIATADGVMRFAADGALRRFVEQGEVRLPEDGPIYSVNEGHRDGWPEATAQAVARFTQGRSTRYTGCFVSDVHRVLSEGGIYAYPPTANHPDGKLRLFYEVIPLGYVVQAAGGAVATELGPLEPRPGGGLDDTAVVYIGSRVPVAQALGES